MRRLVIASANRGKLTELRALLAGLPLEVVSAREVGLTLADDEPFETFADNAAHKALLAAEASGELALADDSGLEVEALGGRPGVLSARVAATDPERIAWLLQHLRGVPDSRREARFVCVAALARPGELLGTWRGEVVGRITAAPRGAGGFGYDPVFCYPPAGLTFGEMTAQEKNQISHRTRALQALREALPEILARIEADGGG